MAYSVRLDVFEGPLDLLLHLIQKAQIDIYDIPIAEITDQYMGYLSKMADLDLEIASEFVTLAATLLSIKIRMLLPRPAPLAGQDEAALDPRVELVQALLEYSAYKQAAESLREMEADMSGRIARAESADSTKETIYTGPLKATLWDLIQAMNGILQSTEPAPPIEIRIEKHTFQAAFFKILRTLRRHKGERVRFRDFFSETPVRGEVVVVFLAVLELSRQGRLILFQESPFTEICAVEAEGRRPIERSAQPA